uniref:Mobilization protein n=1 Tax=Caenorhabditis tropicalis TaxID=1561998 RepID=A0A1I7T3B6_9PELO
MSSEDNENDGRTRKPTRPFLKKGQ